MMSTAEIVLGVLADISEAPEVRHNLDLCLYDGLLDSLRTGAHRRSVGEVRHRDLTRGV